MYFVSSYACQQSKFSSLSQNNCCYCSSSLLHMHDRECQELTMGETRFCIAFDFIVFIAVTNLNIANFTRTCCVVLYDKLLSKFKCCFRLRSISFDCRTPMHRCHCVISLYMHNGMVS